MDLDLITSALLSELVLQHELSDLPEDQQFEHFTAYSIISSHHSEDFSTDGVVVGGGNDLSIDACAIILNGRLVTDEAEVDDILKINGYLEVEFIFIQAKRSSNFDGSRMMTLCQNIKNGIFGDDDSLPKNDDIKSIIKMIRKIYSHAAKLRGNPECRIYYATTGNWQDDAYLSSIISRQIQELIATNMFKGVQFHPLGATQLQKFYRDTKYSIDREISFERVVVLPAISKIKASYLGVLPASEFLKLIIDEEDNLIPSIFIDNVRDFQGDNPVNQDIATTIDSGFLDQFVIRNNGVTIVARDLAITGQRFSVRDYQIVNGCQTSHVLFAHRKRIAAATDVLFVPVKLIHTDDEEIIQDVIKSTNRQTPIDENDLLALTKFQRDLETYYSGFSGGKRLYYERRSRQYANTAAEKTRIVPVGMQLKVFASMFLDAPHQAGRYQATLLQAVGDRVFKSTHRQEPYYTAALAFYRLGGLLIRGHGGNADLRSFKFHFLIAFRYRFENSDRPSFEQKEVGPYCAALNTVLWDDDTSRAAFEVCADLVRQAASIRGLSIVRDTAKVRELADAIKELATSQNPRMLNKSSA